MNKLSILIPTYKREKELFIQLERIMSQMEYSLIDIVVIDNDPDSTISYKIHKLNPSIKYIKNKFNIGGGANILRGFEYINTKWVWLLSDDDSILGTSLQTIINDIDNCSNSIKAIKYDSPIYNKQKNNIIISNQKQLSEYIKDSYFLSNYIFMSTWVFNADSIEDSLRLIYNDIGGYMPQVFLSLYLLKYSSILLSKNQIVFWERSYDSSVIWNGTRVHNMMYEHMRINTVVEECLVKSFRFSLFNEHSFKGKFGRYFRSKNHFGSKLTNRIIFGRFSYSIFLLPVFEFLNIVMMLMVKNKRFKANILNKLESGSDERL